MQPMTAALLERLVLSKPYFDRQGLVVATDEGRPVGFVHAGFSGSADGSGLATSIGATCMLLVAPHESRSESILQDLLARSEEYLRSRGAQILLGGATAPADAFYLGLYGGSELPGVLVSDQDLCRLYEAAGYQPTSERVVLHRQLAGFRPPVDRVQMQLKRTCLIQADPDPPAATWWEACTTGHTERIRFSARPRTLADDGCCSTNELTVWTIEPLASSWGVHAIGLTQVRVDPKSYQDGLAMHLISEALRHVQSEGATLVEVQVLAGDTAPLELYTRLGFHEVDRGITFRKES